MQDSSLLQSRLSRGTPSSLGRLFQSILLAWRFLAYYVTCLILSHPYPLRVLFAALRRLRPVAVIGKTVLVSKASDVREVLDRFDDFTLAEILGPKMPWGPLLLSLDWREQHARERQLLQSVVFRDADVQSIRKLVAEGCRALIRKKQASGELDVVRDLCDPILIEIITTYFGIPIAKGDPETTRILGDVAGFILAEPPAHSRRWIRSYDSMAKLTNVVLKQIDHQDGAVSGAPTPADDLLTRLVKLIGATPNAGWYDKDWVRRFVTGLAATGGGTIVRAATHAIDRLIAHPAALRKAQALAAELENDRGADHRRCELRQIIYEALRFRPMLPLLVRYSPRATTIGKGTGRARMVPAGATVVAAPIAAMFDPQVFEKPWRFSPERSPCHYAHFGYGPRICFGKYVADVALVEIIRSLALLPNLRRAPGLQGRVRHDGPVASSLRLAFDRDESRQSSDSGGMPA